jgi:hypothetical protein
VTLAALAVPAVATSAIVLKATASNQSITHKSGFLFRVLLTLSSHSLDPACLRSHRLNDGRRLLLQAALFADLRRSCSVICSLLSPFQGP